MSDDTRSITRLTLPELETRAKELSQKRQQLASVKEVSEWATHEAEFKSLGDQLDLVLEEHARKKGVAFMDELTMPGHEPGTPGWSGPGSAPAGAPGTQQMDGPVGAQVKSILDQGLQLVGPPQLEFADGDVQTLHAAAVKGLSARIGTKDLTSGAGGSMPLTTMVLPPLAFRREPTRILSLIPTTTSSSPIVRYYVTTGTSGAAAVAEGDLKPESSITYTPVDVTATKIAHRIRANDEAIKDIPAFVGVLRQDMTNGVIEAENAELLSASVTGAHKFPGLLNTTGITVRPCGTDTVLDAIEQATLDTRVGGSYVEPDGIIMNPLDWSKIRRTKDADQRYLVSVDPQSGTAPRLWGIPVVVTTQMPAGTALVGAFADSVQAAIVDSLVVEVGRSQDDFDRNKTSMRAEERLILMVPRPAGLVKITGLAA